MEENATSTSSSLPLTDVRLIVKSANQQFEDQIIQSVPTWTIRQLKAHLTKVYPSNPTVSEQKLIYSGRLLSDELVLKDILRSYKDVETENHIFHLVYTPKISALKPTPPQVQPQENPLQKLTPDKAMSSSTASTSADGLRHRNVSSSAAAPVASTSKAALANELRYRNAAAASAAPVASTSKAALAAASKTSATPVQQTPNMANPFIIPQAAGAAAAGCPNNFPSINLGYPNLMPYGFPIPINNSMPAEHQAAVYNWVQQVYANYMEQCLKMADETLATHNAAQIQSFPTNMPLLLPPPPQFFPQQSTPAPQVKTASSAAAAPRSIPTVDLDGPSTSRAAAAAFAPRAIPVIPKPAQPQPAAAATAAPTPVPPPPAPAQPENAEQAQPRFPNIVQEEQENRDWLDSFYSITRLLALLTLVYFYSSPLRCLVVAVIAVGIYLYHTGFFQTRRSRNNNNNQNVNANNANNAPAAAQERDPLNPNPPVDPAAGDAGQNAAAAPGAGPATAAAAAGVGAGAATATSSRADITSSSASPPGTEQTSTSLIAFVRTFVVSFFASLLPETPTL